MPNRSFSAENHYRYGFNGKEKDGEISGDGNQYDYGFRIYNVRLSRFLSVDPLATTFPYYTPYQFAGNSPIEAIDIDGLEKESSKIVEFTKGFGKAVLEGTVDVFKRIINNPIHAGYGGGIQPNTGKPPTQAEFRSYEFNWQQQINPYWQINKFSENLVYGTTNFVGGIIDGDGERTAKSIPQLANAAATIGIIRGLSSTAARMPYQRGFITSDKGVVWKKAREAVGGDLATAAELRVAKSLKAEGNNVHFIDSDKGHAAGTGTFDFTVDGVKTDVKRIQGLGRNAVSDVAKAVDQVGEGGQVIVVRPANSKFTLEQYENSLIKNFKPKKEGVTIKVVNESSLPKL